MRETRARLHLDRPIAWQLGEWLQGLARFDLGRSLRSDQPVGELVRERAAHTATLAFVALAFATIVAIPLGLVTGAYPRGMLARLVARLARAGGVRR
jgi:peptide/nickel transport system permease protein